MWGVEPWPGKYGEGFVEDGGWAGFGPAGVTGRSGLTQSPSRKYSMSKVYGFLYVVDWGTEGSFR
jgi:hypothetical protein